MSVEFDVNDWRACVYVAAEVVRQRQLRGTPIPAWLREHLPRCEHQLAMSRRRHGLHESCRDDGQLEEDELIDTAAAGSIVGWSDRRQVQRRAHDLGGQLVGGVWVFRRRVVEDFARERRATNG